MRSTRSEPVLSLAAAALGALSVLAVAAAHAAPTSAIVGGLETSLLDGRDGRLAVQAGPAAAPASAATASASPQGPQPGSQQGPPTTARLERVYSSSIGSSSSSSAGKAKAGRKADKMQQAAASAASAAARNAESYASYARTGNRVHLTPAGTPSENPAPCAVGGRHFLHGQQVTRSDPCEFCLCLDGEMFCWWQDCPPSTAQGPCRGRPAFSSCQDEVAASAAAATPAADGVAPSASLGLAVPGDGRDAASAEQQQASLETDVDAALNDTSTSAPAAGTGIAASRPLTTGAVQDPTTVPQAAQPAAGTSGEQSGTEASGPSGQEGGSSVATASANATTTSVPATTELMCHVLGSAYRVGEVLPRDTGSCLQCECSPAGRVTCSPKDCLSVREEEDVYQPASSLDMFDVDSF